MIFTVKSKKELVDTLGVFHKFLDTDNQVVNIDVTDGILLLDSNDIHARVDTGVITKTEYKFGIEISDFVNIIKSHKVPFEVSKNNKHSIRITSTKESSILPIVEYVDQGFQYPNMDVWVHTFDGGLVSVITKLIRGTYVADWLDIKEFSYVRLYTCEDNKIYGSCYYNPKLIVVNKLASGKCVYLPIKQLMKLDMTDMLCAYYLDGDDVVLSLNQKTFIRFPGACLDGFRDTAFPIEDTTAPNVEFLDEKLFAKVKDLLGDKMQLTSVGNGVLATDDTNLDIYIAHNKQ
jgi:hypothetical protein